LEIVIFFTIAFLTKGAPFECTLFSDGLLRFSVALEPEVGFPDDLVFEQLLAGSFGDNLSRG
jgi:negative regulator of sigma E activity